MRAWVIEPGFGSVWLDNAYYEGDFVVGETWDDSDRGSAFMPDDYTGQKIALNFPRNLILRIEPALAAAEEEK